MTPPSPTTWDISRFWQTLTYFEVIPWVNCWQRFFKGQSSPASSPMIRLQPPLILVLDPLNPWGTAIAQALLAQDQPVRIIVEPGQLDRAYQTFGNGLEIFSSEVTPQQGLASVTTVVNAGQLTEPWQKELLALAPQLLPSPELMLFDFRQPSDRLKDFWGAVDDVVMGGVSQSQLQLREGKAIFSGQVSTANNGGFASVRSRNLSEPLDLSRYDGFELRITGDGKRYKLISRCEGQWDGLSYCYSFDTLNNATQTIRIPFNQLIPVFRAKTVPEKGKFDARSVYSLQLMHSKFEYDGALNPTFSPGLFYLEIETIRAYAQAPCPQWLALSPPTHDSVSIPRDLLYQPINLENQDPAQVAADCCRILKITPTVRR